MKDIKFLDWFAFAWSIVFLAQGRTLIGVIGLIAFYLNVKGNNNKEDKKEMK